MKKVLFAAVLAATMMLGACGSNNANKENDSVATTEELKTSADNGIKKYLTTAEGLPVIVDFSAEWCPPCRELKPVFHKLKEDYAGKIDMVTVNVDSMPELAREYNVSSIPTLIYFSPDGKELHRTVGFRTSEEITSDINKMLSK